MLSHPNAILAPQARQARDSGENLNYVTLFPQARHSGEILNYLLSRYSDILPNDHWSIVMQATSNLNLNASVSSLSQVQSFCRKLK